MPTSVKEESGAMVDNTLEVRVKRISYEAENINSYELVAPFGGDLLPFTAGGHIDLHLPNGMIRSYSLVNDQRDRHRYVIAVNKDVTSRGGSAAPARRVCSKACLTIVTSFSASRSRLRTRPS
jgi:ferredoxin-NADP reductase